MKRTVIRKVLGGAAVIALVAGLAACGDDRSAPTGQVTKGPVEGATVKDKNGVVIGKTDSNGKFPLYGEAPFTTSGGQYVDLATKTKMNAPDLKAPAGAKNITPITTLIAENPALKAKIESLGIKFDDPLSTVTAANKDAIALNECIGAALTTIIKNGGSSSIAAFLSQVATQLSNLTVTAGQANLEDIENLMVAASTAALPPSIATSVNSALVATYTAAAALKEGENLPTVTPTTPTTPVTGTTGGTSGGTSIK